jgi:plastocyanin
MHRRFSVALASVLTAASLVAPTTAAPTATRLNATVGPGFTITLRTAAGAKVTRLKAGTYRITVRDRASFHNFHLRGPGLNRRTGVEFVGTRTWTVTLRAGRYSYICDPHATSLRGSFRVA